MAYDTPITSLPIESKDDLLVQLTFMYALILASEQMLQDAGLDPTLEEEDGHATWLREDILRLGGAIPYVDHDAATIAGSQYYYIRHVHPLMLLGYRAALELHPIELTQVDALEAAYGPLTCMRYHAEHDQAHGAKIAGCISAIKEPLLAKAIEENYRLTVASISAVLVHRQQQLRQKLHEVTR